MKKFKPVVFTLLAALILMTAPVAAASESSIYGHISFVDQRATVLRADGSEEPAAVNLPLVPGDTVSTPVDGRCELQFDNGTVVRLDKDSRLHIASVLARSLTSSWDVTTLDLEKGQVYALPQHYEHEMFQIVTPNAAVHLKSRVVATIRLDDDGGTSFFSDGGKFKVLYGADSLSLKTATVKADRPCAVTAANTLAPDVTPRTIEFRAWNEHVDRNFMKLHQGISAVPPKLLKFGNQALRYWAEKWSSLFGEWVYDDLFGYVWRPADEQFAFTRRPFFDATYTHINGQLFLVPQQLWGWVPAHMGTWVWMTRGWTWIPGDWFHNGVVDDFHGLYTFPTFNYYWDVYRSDGGLGLVPRPGRKDKLPGPMLQIVKKVLKAPDDNQIKREAIRQTVPEIDAKILPPGRPPVPAEAGKPGPLTRPMVKSNGTIHLPDDAGLPRERDWNPDSQVAARNGGRIRYSISGNAVVCPELKRFSRGFDIRQSSLGESGSGQGNGAYAGGTTSSPQPPPPGGANNNSGSDKVGPDGGAKTDKD